MGTCKVNLERGERANRLSEARCFHSWYLCTYVEGWKCPDKIYQTGLVRSPDQGGFRHVNIIGKKRTMN